MTNEKIVEALSQFNEPIGHKIMHKDELGELADFNYFIYREGSLKRGENDAKYTTIKNPVSVNVGDIVTYTIRVYNEGDLAGYAEEVSDYLPDGLGFLVGHTTNIDNYWSIPGDSKTIKLSKIENATKNLSVDDFNDITSLSDVEVVVGKVKLTSTTKPQKSTLTNTKRNNNNKTKIKPAKKAKRKK